MLRRLALFLHLHSLTNSRWVSLLQIWAESFPFSADLYALEFTFMDLTRDSPLRALFAANWSNGLIPLRARTPFSSVQTWQAAVDAVGAAQPHTMTITSSIAA